LQLTSQKAGTASPYTNRLDLTYTYNATSSGQFGVGTTSGNPGQLLSVSGTINGATESASYTYDNLGRLLTSSQTSNSTSAQRRFAYDRWGNRTGVWDATSVGSVPPSMTGPRCVNGKSLVKMTSDMLSGYIGSAILIRRRRR
jgi:YD repeat-containing protein